jgi:hypothetical protein
LEFSRIKDWSISIRLNSIFSKGLLEEIDKKGFNGGLIGQEVEDG